MSRLKDYDDRVNTRINMESSGPIVTSKFIEDIMSRIKNSADDDFLMFEQLTDNGVEVWFVRRDQIIEIGDVSDKR